jgi:hypothetical protein
LDKLQSGEALAQPAVGAHYRADFLDDSIPLGCFVESFCEVGPEFTEKKAVFSHALNLWLEQSGHKAMVDITISKQLRAINSRIDTDRRSRFQGKLTPTFVGIGLSTDGRDLMTVGEYRA